MEETKKDNLAYKEEGKRRMQLRKKKRNNKYISGYEERRRSRCYNPWSCNCGCYD